MYRLLEVGEVIEKGDEYYCDKRWRSFVAGIGSCLRDDDFPVRRLIKPAVTPAAGSVPDPVVSVGDRVKVLSGPWAGCTGVAIGLECYVIMSDWGNLTAKRDSTPVVKLDNVFVGGPQLIVKGIDVEKLHPLPSVVPEVLYRDLSHGETIRKGDQFFDHAGWREQLNSTGCPVACGKFRRPIRLQSPGWRYLDAGETVQAGDEAGFHTEPIWRPALEHFSEGYVIRGLDKEHSETFRRKLPSNQGG